jgi:uncharacterized protein
MRSGCALNAHWGFFEHEHRQNDLAALLGRKVDFVSRRAIEASATALRLNAILNSAVPIYVAG